MEETLAKKLPPHHKDSEIGVVGAMMLNKDAAITAMGALTAEDFFLKENFCNILDVLHDVLLFSRFFSKDEF